MPIVPRIALCLTVLCLQAGAAPVDFDRDVLPILTEHCYLCHGPDAKQRKAKLRFDLPPDQLSEADRRTRHELLSPAKPGTSEFLHRIFTDDEDDLMPPPDASLPLSPTQKETLTQWIAEGAEHSMLWSFVPPSAPPVPPVQDAKWCRNEIDHFVLRRLESLGHSPSLRADLRTLIRRLTFDLTGLPPTPDETAAFLADRSPEAVATVIDRLLASDRFGERLAADWMDAARYADTSGYQYDWPRTMGRWRAWVIDAFNLDLPYNLFIQWQIAGDLMPNAHTAQLIATGFNRNHGFTIEGGTIDEEYRVQYVNDRVTTMGTAFLGLTLECARCHDHKYDPLSQQDFYQLFAFFNKVDEAGSVPGKPLFTNPAIPTPTSQQIQRVRELSAQIGQLADSLHRPDAAADRQQRAWEQSRPVDWQTADGSPPRKSNFNLASKSRSHLAVVTRHPNARLVTALRLEFTPKSVAAVQSGVLFALLDIKVWHQAEDGQSNRVAIARMESAISSGENLTPLLTDEVPDTAWPIDYDKATVLVVAFAKPVSGSGSFLIDLEVASEVEVYLDVTSTFSRQSDPIRRDRTGLLTEYARGLATAEAPKELRRAFRGNELPQYQPILDQLIKAERDVERLRAAVPMTMVMRDEVERETFILERGAYDRKKERVQAGTPRMLPPMPAGAPPNRLGLAQWLTMPENPLVSRVAVNRFWQQLFGVGLVRTPEDFGSQGERPSHPQLLDWLAVDFVQSGWNVKGLIRKICLSSTYQQASTIRLADAAWDPANRHLARQSRRRLPAEMVRDNALAISGLLAELVGSSSVLPYQPDGLWEQLTNRDKYQQKYVTATGDDLYRRSLYTYWKRANHHPVMALFDAPSREVCTVRRPVTNTPLQALALLNETLFVEAARSLGARMLTDPKFGRNDAERCRHAFEWATSRVPEKLELFALQSLLTQERQSFKADPDSADRLLAVGESPRPDKVSTTELAAFTMVARALLNLSETITKP